jgi:nitric oxide reductase subunit C
MVAKLKFTIVCTLFVFFILYSVYLYSFQPVQSFNSNKAIYDGKALWQQYNCNACHQLYGLGGFLGPDLTNEYSLRGPAFINAFLKTGTDVMPVFNLSDNEIAALSLFLQSVDSSGKSDPRTYSIGYDGTIEQ